MPNKIDKNIFSPRPRNHSWTVVFMVLVLLDAFLYIRAFLYEDDRPLVYPDGDMLCCLLFWFHDPLLLGNKKPASPFGGSVKRKAGRGVRFVPLRNLEFRKCYAICINAFPKLFSIIFVAFVCVMLIIVA